MRRQVRSWPGGWRRTRGRRARRLVHALALGALSLAACREPARQPNLIVISVDTLRPDHLSAYGYVRDTSPAIDALAQDGVRFDAAFAQAPWTIPSHASLLTGRYPCAHGANDQRAISPAVPTLAEYLRRAGFRTAGFVETTVYLTERFGFDRGFDIFRLSGHAEGWPFGNIVSWLRDRKNDGEPFFLFWHKFGTHGPYRPPVYVKDRYLDKQRPQPMDRSIRMLSRLHYHDYLKLHEYRTLAEIVADYDAAIRAVDDQIATLMAAIRGLGLYEDTVVVVTSDHGESLFDREVWVGHGLFLYDDEIHVPLVIKPAGQRVARPAVDTVVESIDVVPTVMALLGLPVPDGLDGQSLDRLIRDGTTVGLRDFAVGLSSNLGETGYLRTPAWKYIGPAKVSLEQVRLRLGARSARTLPKQLKLEEQLYFLKWDAGERNNVAARRPMLTRTMRNRLAQVLAPCHATQPPAVPVPIDEAERARLRALGYAH
jgi:arylsulfatase A-like enzyme